MWGHEKSILDQFSEESDHPRVEDLRRVEQGVFGLHLMFVERFPQLRVSGLELPLLSLAPLPDEDCLSDEVSGQAPELGRLGDVGELLGLVLEDVVRFLLSSSPEVSDGVPGLPIGVVGGLFLGASRSWSHSLVV